MLAALGLPQLGDGAGTAQESTADEFCTLDLHGLGVPMGKPMSAQAGQAVLFLQNAFYLVHFSGHNTIRNPSEISPDVSSALM